MGEIEAMHTALLSWYAKNGRHELPWRNTDDIYHIYLSEIMLQQTQVNRVAAEYYPKFLQRFPTLKSISEATLDEVLALWSGLGYYSRARNLYKCAKETKGILPKRLSELEELCGIGKYTASAVCSFGMHQSVPVVDTNISRVLKRFFALKSASSDAIWQRATSFLNTKNPREHNLALMDLGAMVCLAKSPKCNLCPLNVWCVGKESPEYFTKVAKKEYIAMELFYGVCIKDDRVALVSSKGAMYKDMLELPSVDPIDEDFLGSFKHSYTKYRLNVNLYATSKCDKEATWVALDAFDSAPISSLTKKAKEYFGDAKKREN